MTVAKISANSRHVAPVPDFTGDMANLKAGVDNITRLILASGAAPLSSPPASSSTWTSSSAVQGCR
jgi:hypothetical protein